MSYLAVVDRAYRGSAEAQFFDAFYGILTLGEQIGGIDLALRGSAVTAAIDAPASGPRLRAGALIVVMPDPRAPIRAMLAAGISVYADKPGLAVLRIDPAALIPGVRCVDTAELAAGWAERDGVWFL